MNRLLKSRYKAYLKKAAKVNRLLKKGYMIFDDYGHRVNEPFKLDKADKKIYRENKYVDCTSRMIYYAPIGNWYNDTTVKEINEKWTSGAIAANCG